MCISSFRVFLHAYNLQLQNVFLVVANMRIKSIQKQIVEYNIKSKYPEEYSTVDKVGSEKPLASKYCFV